LIDRIQKSSRRLKYFEINIATDMLKEVSIYNFRCIRELELEFKPLTILVGPNASGKSSILYAIMWFAKKYLTSPLLDGLVPS
jgi:predicted ATPase